MPITEGNATAQGAPAPVIDASAIADAFTQSLKRSGLMVTPAQGAPQRPEVDHFQETLKQIAANPETDEKALGAIKTLFESFEKSFSEKVGTQQRSEFYNALAVERDRSTVNMIYMALDGYIGEDDFLRSKRDVIKNEVIETFNNDPKYAAAAQKYGQGDVDIDALKKIALDKVNEWNKGRGGDKKEKKGPTGMNKLDASVDGSLPSGSHENSGNFEDPRSMPPRERDLYYAKIGTAQRAGMRPESDKAKEFAMKGVMTFREGQRKAKEKLGRDYINY
jgi:hypothetical protein